MPMPLERATQAGSHASPFRLKPPSLSAAAALLIMLAPAYAAHAATGEPVHVVGKGETLYWIAKHYHVSVDAIREANDLGAVGKRGAHIHPGLSLVIPQSGKARASIASASATAGTASRRGRADKDTQRGKKATAAHPPPAADEKPAHHHPVRRGFIHLVRGSEALEAQLVARHGRLAPKALAGFRHLLRFYPTGAETQMDPRLAALVGQVSDHFGGKPLHVVSGFRPYTPAQYTPHSNHNVGRAMDFSVEGVPNTVVRDYCRTFRDAGVGYYPNSTFVHLDVRAGKAYWVDYSHPGEAPHYDSPSARGSADESTTDVEPAGHDNNGATDPGPGSAETR